mmetsp:Transcript_15467/g.65267  ORF Transcript_15467/g.65267 Transcript_15467/m.65267 type:complete len:249 (-) Transcript_15467:148-894(-)
MQVFGDGRRERLARPRQTGRRDAHICAVRFVRLREGLRRRRRDGAERRARREGSAESVFAIDRLVPRERPLEVSQRVLVQVAGPARGRGGVREERHREASKRMRGERVDAKRGDAREPRRRFLVAVRGERARGGAERLDASLEALESLRGALHERVRRNGLERGGGRVRLADGSLQAHLRHARVPRAVQRPETGHELVHGRGGVWGVGIVDARAVLEVAVRLPRVRDRVRRGHGDAPREVRAEAGDVR